jgi:hypothetical protein
MGRKRQSKRRLISSGDDPYFGQRQAAKRKRELVKKFLERVTKDGERDE